MILLGHTIVIPDEMNPFFILDPIPQKLSKLRSRQIDPPCPTRQSESIYLICIDVVTIGMIRDKVLGG